MQSKLLKREETFALDEMIPELTKDDSANKDTDYKNPI